MNKTLMSLIIVVAILSMGALVLGWSGVLSTARANTGAGTDVAEERIANVDVRVLQAVTVDDRLELTGTLACWEDVILSSEVRGKVEWCGVAEGDAVTAGEEVMRIDTEALRLRLDEAKAQQRLAEQDYERIQRLSKQGATTAQNLDSAIASRDVTDATVKSVDLQLRKSVIKAPFDGIVDKLLLDQEEFVDIGTALLRIVQVDKVKAMVGIPERDAAQFEKGDEVRVTVDAHPGREFTGTIHRIATTGDLSTHTFSTEVTVDNAEGLLKPGMIARLTFVRASYPDSIVAPIFCVLPVDDKRFVAVHKDGRAEVREVEVGIIQGNEVQILNGLSPGEELIVAGQYDVHPGQKVNVHERFQ